MYAIELGQFLFPYESGSLVSTDIVPDDDLPRPRTAADEAAAWTLSTTAQAAMTAQATASRVASTAKGAMSAGVIWSDQAVPRPARPGEDGVTATDGRAAPGRPPPSPARIGPR